MKDNIADIRVFGVGGGGCNALNRMIDDKLEGVSFFAVNTDAQDLRCSNAKNKIAIGSLGAGADPKTGKRGAVEHAREIQQALKGADMVYLTAGMGGGTGTGATPVIAKIAKEMGILTIAIVTTPFVFEGSKRDSQARQGIKELENFVDSLIVVSNERLLQSSPNMSIKDGFAYADEVLKKGVKSIIDIVQSTALINLDFADVKAIMSNAGKTMIGIGEGKGENKAEEAAKNAINSPLLETSPKGASKAIINVTGGKNISIQDANKAIQYINQETESELDTIFGISVSDEIKDDSMVVTIILTGLNAIANGPTIKPEKNEHSQKTDYAEILDEELFSFAKPHNK